MLVQEAKADLFDAASARYPDTFAGLWIDHAVGGKVFVAFTQSADDKVAALAGGFAFPDRLVAVDADHPLTELLDVYELVTRDFARLREAGLDLRTAALHVPRNSVVVGVDTKDPAAVRRGLKERYGREVADVIEVVATRVEPQAMDTECNSQLSGEDKRFNCASPLRGGLAIGREREQARCTLSFTARTQHGQDAVLTAGHCAEEGEVWGHGSSDATAVPRIGSGDFINKRIGRVSGSVEPRDRRTRDVDAALVPLDAEGQDNFDVAAWTYRVPAAQAQHVGRVARTPGAYLGAVGDMLCKSGKRTYETCGRLIWPFATGYMFDEAVAVRNQLAVSACLRAGDSGSPIYRKEADERLTAFGIANVGIAEDGECGRPRYRLELKGKELLDVTVRTPVELLWGTKAIRVEEEFDVEILSKDGRPEPEPAPLPPPPDPEPLPTSDPEPVPEPSPEPLPEPSTPSLVDCQVQDGHCRGDDHACAKFEVCPI